MTETVRHYKLYYKDELIFETFTDELVQELFLGHYHKHVIETKRKEVLQKGKFLIEPPTIPLLNALYGNRVPNYKLEFETM